MMMMMMMMMMMVMVMVMMMVMVVTVAETWRRVWGDGNFFRGPRFLNDGFFLVSGQVFRIFHSFYMTLSSQEKPLKNHYFRKEFAYDTFFYSVRTFGRIDNTSLLLKILGGTDTWAVPTSNFRPWVVMVVVVVVVVVVAATTTTMTTTTTMMMMMIMMMMMVVV